MEYYSEAVIVPLIIAITELVKTFGLSKKYAPVFAWILGLIMAYIYVSPGNIKETFFIGSALGLSASGLFSGTKTMIRRR